MITKQERIKLRSMAMNIKPTVWVGKDGFSASVLKQIGEELYIHELIKISLLENADELTKDELCQMATTLGADVVTTIGKKIVLYKLSDKDGIKHILAK